VTDPIADLSAKLLHFERNQNELISRVEKLERDRRSPVVEPAVWIPTEEQAWQALDLFFDGASENKSDHDHDVAQAAYRVIKDSLT
jgi:hypothetical protein